MTAQSANRVDIASAVERLVELKRRLDGMYLSGMDTGSPRDPGHFYRCVLPLFPAAPIDLELGIALDRSDRPVVTGINPHRVIGASWSSRWSQVLGESPAATMDLLHRLNADVESDASTSPPLYLEVSPLGLYVAYEGKNRVEAARRAGVSLSARVATVTAPPPHELALSTDTDGRRFLRRGAQGPAEVCCDASVRLLLAYGVEVTPGGPGASASALTQWGI